MVRSRKIIQSLFGWALLLIFSLSITPKQLLHDALADHTDSSVHFTGKAYVTKTGYSCDVLNLVAESPFTEADTFTENIPVQHCTDFVVVPTQTIDLQSISLPGLRGPPSI